jgi:hypothetical protein
MDILAYKTSGITTELVPHLRWHNRHVVIFNGRFKKYQEVQVSNESKFNEIPSDKVSNITANELEVKTNRSKRFSTATHCKRQRNNKDEKR